MNAPLLTIVICNYNKKEFLEQCLESVIASDLMAEPVKVIVVDNASTDGSQQLVNSYINETVTLVELPVNLGGAGGFARGMTEALNTGSPFVALLDNDIKLAPSCLRLLIEYLQQNPAVGVAGAKICTMDNPDILQELGSFINWKSYSVSTPLKGHKDTEELPVRVVCDYVPACCMVTRRDVIQHVGKFDPQHFIYWDDMDWCTRVRKGGYEIHALRDAKVMHKMGAIHATNTFSNYYFERNRILYFLKHADEEVFSQFATVLVEQLVPLTFFAHRKGTAVNAISSLLGITDILAGQLYAQPQQIMPKADIDELADLNLSNVQRIFLEPSNDCRANQNVISALRSRTRSSLFSSSRTFIEASNEVLQFLHAPGNNDTVIYIADHILSFVAPVNAKEGYIVDTYLNQCRLSELSLLNKAYSQHKRIFLATIAPVLIAQLKFAYQRYHKRSFADDR